jgi:hypothetical protein
VKSNSCSDKTILLPANKSRYSKQEEKKRSFTTRRRCVWASAAAENIHTLQDNPILQARILTVEGSNNTLGINYTFGEVRPSLGRRRGRRISTLKDDINTTPGPSPPGPSPGIRLEQTARPPPRGLSQLSPEGIGPACGLGNSTPALVPPVDDPARLRPTKSSFRANSASVRADTATSGFGSSKSGRGFI